MTFHFLSVHSVWRLTDAGRKEGNEGLDNGSMGELKVERVEENVTTIFKKE